MLERRILPYMGVHWFRRGCGNRISEPQMVQLR